MTVSAKAAADMKPKTITRPAITLLAMTTPSTFYDTLRSTKIQDGFLNRFLVVEHQAPREPRRKRQDVDAPASVVAWIKQLLEPEGNLDPSNLIDVAPDPTVVPLTDRSQLLASSFEREMLDLSVQLEQSGLGDMPIRAAEIALRLSLIVSLSEVPDTPTVLHDHLDWSQRYVRFFLEQTIAIVRERVADSATERTRNVILAAIRGAGSQGVTEQELHREKPFISVAKRERLEAIESLITAELIAWASVPSGKRGRPRQALVGINADLTELNENDPENSTPQDAA
jgi:hypothetical protein